MIMDDLIICVAPYPSEKQKEKFHGKMDIVQEVVSCCNAGASLAHLHVRNPEGLQTTDTHWFQSDIEKIHTACPIIIEGSTGGMPEHTLAERCVSFTVPGVEMGSLNLGSTNMYDGIFCNKVADIYFYAGELKKRNLVPFCDLFDLSHFSCLERLEKDKLISPPYTIALIFDYPDTLTYKEKYLDFYLTELPKGSNWFLTRPHAKGAEYFIKAIEMGGHVRVGYEDGPFLSNGRRARSNAELVEEVVKLAQKVGRKVADPAKAREIIGIKKPKF